MTASAFCFIRYKFLCLIPVFYIFTFTSCKGDNSTPATPAASQNQTDNTAEDRTEKPGRIVFFGNSITAGWGLDLSESFPAVIQQKIDSLNLNYQVINAGISGETSAAGLNRVDWILRQHVDIFVLELGGNDGLRGLDLSLTQQNLQGIMNKVKSAYPEADIILAGMEVPPSMGSDYAAQFRRMFAELAAQNPDVVYLPFILEGVGGEPHLNLPDGIHPTAEGQRIVAQNVWRVLAPLLNK